MSSAPSFPSTPLGPSNARECLSALLDGEADPQVLSDLLARWRDDDALRSTWHAYQLLGDVMRSEDLAARADADEAFLQRLRGRLAAEPAIVAPLPEALAAPLAMTGGTGMPARRRWSTPIAMAAGVAVVAGAVVVVQRASLLPAGGLMADSGRSTADAGLARTVAQAAAPASAPDLQMIRDARIDWYLQAHRQYAPGSTLGGPGGTVRSVEWVPPKP